MIRNIYISFVLTVVAVSIGVSLLNMVMVILQGRETFVVCILGGNRLVTIVVRDLVQVVRKIVVMSMVMSMSDTAVLTARNTGVNAMVELTVKISSTGWCLNWLDS